MKRLFPLSLLSLMILNIQGAYAEEPTDSAAKVAATMPTIKIEAMSELDPIKSYIDYDKANVTRNGLDKKDIPQTVDTIDVQKYKIYGSNDLSVMLQGTPGYQPVTICVVMGSRFVVLLPTQVIFTVMAYVKADKYVVVQPISNVLKF
jgi:hypothetical protein